MSNAKLSDAQRHLLEMRYQVLRRNLQHVMEKVDMVDQRLQPAVDELLREYTATQDAATKAGLRAPVQTIAPPRYRRQQPGGWSR